MHKNTAINKGKHMGNTVNTRELILGILTEVLKEGAHSHLVIRSVLDKYDYLDRQDKAFIKRVSEGTLERLLQIDEIIRQFSSVKPNKLKPIIHNILRMSIYQILFMDSVPDSAACNEAVKLAKQKGFVKLSGFVNGVLRNVARNRENIHYPDKEKEPVSYLSLIYSMPVFIVDMWIEAYGMEATERILQGLMEERPVTVRICESLLEEEKLNLLKQWEQADILFEKHPYLSYAYKIKNAERVNRVPGFLQGQIMVQDVSSMLAVEIAGIKEGNTIFDVCAAPGGKSLHAADKLHGSGQVIARDITEYKTSLIAENAARANCRNIMVQVQDALAYKIEDEEKAHLVIADLPCSGLGIAGRKQDIKYKVTPEGIASLVKLQREILQIISSYVKVGGTLIYSTCTINQEENEENVRFILKNLPFEALDMRKYLPKLLQTETAKQGYLQLLPGIHDTDGFFMAAFRRIEG